MALRETLQSITLRRTVALMAFTLAAGCSSAIEVREGPQAVSPSGSETMAVATMAEAPAASVNDLATELFTEFCLGQPNAAAREAALTASGRFDAPIINMVGGARYAIYPLSGAERTSVGIVSNSITGIECSVGVNNVGPSLFEGGRIG